MTYDENLVVLSLYSKKQLAIYHECMEILRARDKLGWWQCVRYDQANQHIRELLSKANQE